MHERVVVASSFVPMRDYVRTTDGVVRVVDGTIECSKQYVVGINEDDPIFVLAGSRKPDLSIC